jgi:hypothetical protein
MKITLQRNGVQKRLEAGFSLKYLLFGAWLPLFQGYFWKSMKHSLLIIITLSIYYWIKCFKYNAEIIGDYLDKGWLPDSDLDRDLINRL